MCLRNQTQPRLQSDQCYLPVWAQAHKHELMFFTEKKKPSSQKKIAQTKRNIADFESAHNRALVLTLCLFLSKQKIWC